MLAHGGPHLSRLGWGVGDAFKKLAAMKGSFRFRGSAEPPSKKPAAHVESTSIPTPPEAKAGPKKAARLAPHGQTATTSIADPMPLFLNDMATMALGTLLHEDCSCSYRSVRSALCCANVD